MLRKCCGCGKSKDEEDDDDGSQEGEESSSSEESPSIGSRKQQDTPLAEKESQTVEESKKKNTHGLTIDPTEEAELQEMGMDASVLLEPLTPRSMMTGTPYPGKRSSVVLATAGAAWSSQDSDTPSDGLPPPCPREVDGTVEPPATPVGKEDMAMRRHRFFSDLLSAAQTAAEHRVRFDPTGPRVAGEADARGLQPQLESLLDRLENVTSRLENTVLTASASPPPSAPVPASAAAAPATLITPPPAFNLDSASDNMSVAGYQDIISGPLASYLQLSAQLGGDVAIHANAVRDAFQTQLQFLNLAASRAQPNQSELMSLLQPTSQRIQAIQEFREKNRPSPLFNHLSAVSESIPALGWVAVSPTPAPFVKEMRDAGQFYTNRVLKDFKEKDKRHVDWVNAWVQVLTDLQAFVKQHHTTGLVWSAKGGAGAGAPPPPPPIGAMPPPPPLLDLADLSIDPSKDRSALFAEINQGENITRNLKKVTSEMQTHKNPNLRGGPATLNSSGGGRHTSGPAAAVDKPPNFTREGKKWLIEYQKGNKNLIVSDAEMNNVIYMFRCVDSNLQVKGKVNSIVMDSCKKSSVVFDSLVSSVEFVNCQSVQMQVMGIVPTITIDKTDGCQMYLSKDSLNVEIVSSKSSEMNVLIPTPSGDYSEFPIPEQYKTTVSRNGLTTTAVESLG